jgi:hypothetical protein
MSNIFRYTILGWGALSFATNAPPSDTLRATTVSEVPRGDCLRQASFLAIRAGESGIERAYVGDSGGPLIYDPVGQWRIYV